MYMCRSHFRPRQITRISPMLGKHPAQAETTKLTPSSTRQRLILRHHIQSMQLIFALHWISIFTLVTQTKSRCVYVDCRGSVVLKMCLRENTYVLSWTVDLLSVSLFPRQHNVLPFITKIPSKLNWVGTQRVVSPFSLLLPIAPISS